jgi:hypothetical protein
MSVESFDRLIDQIDLFIRKFYKNQIIKGVVWFSGIFLVTFLLTTTLEYFGRFGTPVRAVLFFSFLLTNIFVLIRFLIVPLSKLYSFGNRINRYQASQIIGTFFPNVSDRLLNTLQLNDDLSGQTGNIELLRASVSQRAESLSVIPFASAIDVKENLKYVKWVAPIFFLFLTIAVVSPDLFTEGSKRVVNYSTIYVPEAPFKFQLADFKNEVAEGTDIELNLKLVGEEIPQKVYLISPQGKQLMTISGRNSFTATIPKVSESGNFYFEANEFSSKEFYYSIFGKPVVGQFKAEIIYPKYFGKSNEVINNAGDMIVPEGATVIWNVVTKNTKNTSVSFGDSSLLFYNEGFRFQKKFKKTTPVLVKMKGSELNITDSISFNVNVIKDAHPSIQVEEVKDSLSTGLRFFSGLVRDDYGLTSLKFVYTITSKDGKKRTETLPVRSVSGLEIPFDFGVDFMREKVELEDKIEYYFVVSDNDGVNGSKSTRSRMFTYQLPTLEELNEKREQVQEQGKENLADLLNKTKDFQKDLERLQKDLLNAKSNDWKQKNQLNQLKNQHSDLLKSLEQTKEMLQNSSEEKQQLSKEDDAFIEKQKLIEDLLNQLMDDELRKLLDDLEKLMEQNNKEDQQKTMDELKMSSEEMNKQLDRSLEMLKKMQVDEKIDAIEQELKKLAADQEQLQKDTESKKLSKEEAEKKQDAINDKFEQLKDDLDQLDKINKELNRPMDLPSTEEQEKSIQNELNDAKDNLSKGKQGKAGQNQKSAAEQMKQLAEQMDKAQNDSNKQQQGEDMELLREILESLVNLSLDQEDVMNNFSSIHPNNPNYRKYARVQRTIVDNTIPVSDSLYELAKRQPMLSKFVDEELRGIKTNQKLALDGIGERKMREIASHQQLAMTSYNNLALMLNESLQQMQKQMQSMMEGEGSCDKPGKGTPKPGAGQSMGNMKEMLKKQLEQLEKGSNPNGKKPGDSQGGNKPGQGEGFGGLGNKETAKMAAEQNAIRQRLEQLKNELNKQGKGEGNQLNPLLKELEKQEEDLVNKRFSPDLIRRQQDILTRLLESEKAIRERGFEEKRESNEGKNQNNGNLIRFDQYNKEKLKQIELLRTVDPVYNKYYKDKANQYFNSIKE